MSRVTQKVVFSCMLLLSLLWSVGRILGDGHWLLALLFYFPSPLLVIFLFAALIYFAVKQNRIFLSLASVMVALPVSSIVFLENHWMSPEPVATGIKLVHWNVYSGKAGLQRVMQTLQGQQAHIVAVTEPPGDVHRFSGIFPDDYQVKSTQHLFLAVKGKIHKSVWLYNRNGFRIWYFKIHTEEKNLTVFLVDMASRPSLARDPFLRKLNSYIRQYRPNLVVGDFNAPRRSAALQGLPKGYRHAYDVAGSGWSYTWPWPVPMLAIDHILVDPYLKINGYFLQSGASDHRLQILYFLKN